VASRRAACAYDHSPRTQRLALRLRRADISLPPSRWRCAQLLTALPIATAIQVLTGSPLAAAGGALSLVRVGGRLLLRVRGGRGADALEGAAPVVARAIAAEIAAGCGAASALSGAVQHGIAAADPLGQRILSTGLARVALGEAAGHALTNAVGSVVTEHGGSRTLQSGSALDRLAVTYSILADGGVGTGDALRRLAITLDDEQRATDSARAHMVEARLVAAAVPALAAVVAIALVTSSPNTLEAAFTPLGSTLLAVCVLGATVGVFIVRRMTVAGLR
jgi:Flp pilus assembly protein TadB